MELPEEDKQAFIDAARRRTQPQQGGAAFGVYPSSGKRPEKLNVSRDVNMPAQMARGWAAGTLGLPGDIEGLGRMAANFAFGPGGVNVSETPVLPTSDFYREYLPGYDPAPAAKFASGLGALAGGAGSTKLAGAAVKGAQATGRALGPKAAEMAEGYLQKSGLAPSVIKPKGGNWLSGSVEKATEPLVPKAGQRGEPVSEIIADLRRTYPEEQLSQLEPGTQSYVRSVFEELKPDVAVEDWINTKLNKYIRNEMGTPEDPVRKLAERDVLHVNPEQLNFRPEMHGRYLSEGQTAVAKSPTAKTWEGAADMMIAPTKAGELLSKDTWLADLPQYQKPLEDNPWLAKVSPETSVYALSTEGGRPTVGRDLGFDHLIDELRNATRADSDLPANLRWKPEDLKKVTMEQAVERVAKINEYRAAKKAEANEVLARNPATAPYKDYETVPGTQEPNQKGLAWKQIKAPEYTEGTLPSGFKLEQWEYKGKPVWSVVDEKGATHNEAANSAEEALKRFSGSSKGELSKALKYEGDVMGHCVGGYCDDVVTGKSQIYSLRDKKGEPHVTIEVKPYPKHDNDYIFYELQDKLGRTPTQEEWDAAMASAPPIIAQIKGKGNAAPKAEYLPFVQDFVRSGNWSRVEDFKNTGLIRAGEKSAVGHMLKQAGETNIPPYFTRQEYDQIIERFGMRPGFGLPEGYAKGGLVQDTDAITAKLTSSGMDKDKALTQALRMANAKQEAHMQAGGLATLFKGAKAAKAAEEAAAAANAAKVAKPVEKVLKPAEKAAEAAKPAVNGPQAKALETARKNAVKMLGLPENNTAMDRAKALGFDADTYHGTFNRFENFDLSKANPRSQYMPGVFTADDPRLAENFGDYIMPLRQRQGTTVLERRAARLEGSPLPEVDTIHDKSKGIRVTNNPTNIRSRFAAFDPARVNENDLLGAADPALLAGTAVASGIGLGALGQMSKPKPEQEEKKKAAGGLAKRM